MCKVVIRKSTRAEKKLMAIFTDCSNGRQRTTHFGSVGYSDYIHHRDLERKQRYLDRHRKNEHWDVPTGAGALSRWILWNKTSLRESIADYKRRFNFY